nr:hypothetical protein [Tanacetum cinerariifolium]
PTKKRRKYKPYIIPYSQFTKLIICHLGRTHNIHHRSASPFHLAEEDLRLGNLKFVPKGEDDEVFRMPIPNELISNNIKNAPYYNAYMEMVTKHDRKDIAEKEEKKKPGTAKQLKSKPVKEKSSKPAPTPNLIEHRGGLQLLKRHQLDPMCNHRMTHPQILFVSLCLLWMLKQEKTDEPDQGRAGSDPGKTPKSRPPLDQAFMNEDQARPDPQESHTALAGPNPEPTHDDFMANVYPNVHESLKFPADEHVIIEDPLSLTGTLSSMKNLDDAYTIGDQFLNEKSTKDEPGKLNVEAEVVSMVTVPIYQASSLVPQLSTTVIDLSPSKHVSFTTQTPILTATTTTTTTLLLSPPPQKQSTTD